jgi:hypothetical protein
VGDGVDGGIRYTVAAVIPRAYRSVCRPSDVMPGRHVHRDQSRTAIASRSGVELEGDEVEVGLAVARQVGALGQVLAQEAVGVLAGAPLPGALGVAEVDGDVGSRG